MVLLHKTISFKFNSNYVENDLEAWMGLSLRSRFNKTKALPACIFLWTSYYCRASIQKNLPHTIQAVIESLTLHWRLWMCCSWHKCAQWWSWWYKLGLGWKWASFQCKVQKAAPSMGFNDISVILIVLLRSQSCWSRDEPYFSVINRIPLINFNASSASTWKDLNVFSSA